MNAQIARAWLRRWGLWLLLACLLLSGYWLLPISGRVIVMDRDEPSDLWPRFRLSGARLGPGATAMASVTDIVPWSFVELLVGDAPALQQGQAVEQAGTWTWTWTYAVPEAGDVDFVFYHDCHKGCAERGRWVLGEPAMDSASGPPTKLGVVMPRVDRDWHGRSGWAVEITYALRSDEAYWGVDDVARRVAAHHSQGLRVLIRVDYEQQQTLPPPEDYVALAEYLAYFRRLARDDRLRDVYGFIVGSDYNTLEASAALPSRPITPAWYARVFSGYGEQATNTDNVVQVVRSENASARVIVGPLRPWATDQGEDPSGNAPWLDYMDDLVGLLDEAANEKARAGVPMVGPDGFDVQAPGSPDAPEMSGTLRADEPRTSLSRDAWGGAQAGFRVYEDWMAIINAYPTTRGSPIYVISTNTYDRRAGIPPAQNYPSGWLTSALDVANGEPQIAALVWFLDDFPHGDEWNWFSLTERPGRLVDAAAEFDALLMGP